MISCSEGVVRLSGYDRRGIRLQIDNVIAVIATLEDGWWSGVLLDDARRIPGRTVFPSHFVCLF